MEELILPGDTKDLDIIYEINFEEADISNYMLEDQSENKNKIYFIKLCKKGRLPLTPRKSKIKQVIYWYSD